MECNSCRAKNGPDARFCLACGRSLSPGWTSDQWRGLAIGVALVGLFAWLGVIAQHKPSPQIAASSSTSRSVPAAPLTSNPETKAISGWGYSEYEDEMGRGRVFHTSIESSNTIHLGFPYEGAQHGRLSVREHPEYGKDIYISIDKGQLLDSEYHSKVLVRFDNDKPQSFSSVSPADLSSETLFLRGNAFPVFLARLKTAKTLRIEVPVYQSGNQILDFDVQGFTWKK